MHDGCVECAYKKGEGEHIYEIGYINNKYFKTFNVNKKVNTCRKKSTISHKYV